MKTTLLTHLLVLSVCMHVQSSSGAIFSVELVHAQSEGLQHLHMQCGAYMWLRAVAAQGRCKYTRVQQ